MIKKRDERFFKVAQAIAETSDFISEVNRPIRMGAVIVVKNNILAVGKNSRKTHPIQKSYNVANAPHKTGNAYLHAEMDAIRKLPRWFAESNFQARLYVSRYDMNGNFAMSRPCSSCLAAIKDVGISEIYYTTPDGFTFEKLFLD